MASSGICLRSNVSFCPRASMVIWRCVLAQARRLVASRVSISSSEAATCTLLPQCWSQQLVQLCHNLEPSKKHKHQQLRKAYKHDRRACHSRNRRRVYLSCDALPLTPASETPTPGPCWSTLRQTRQTSTRARFPTLGLALTMIHVSNSAFKEHSVALRLATLQQSPFPLPSVMCRIEVPPYSV